MHSKKRFHPKSPTRTPEPKPTPRPVGMQTMGPTLYEQLRQALVQLDTEMKLVSEN